MKKKLTIGLLICILPLIALGAWQKVINKSNGATAVTIVDAPASGFSRTVPANGGVTVYNNGTSNIAFTIQFAVIGDTTNALEYVVLGADETYINDWVVILDATTNTLEFVGNGGFSTDAHITTKYRDESQ